VNTVKRWFAEAILEHHHMPTVIPFYADPDTAPEAGDTVSWDSDWYTYDETTAPTAFYLAVPETSYGYNTGLTPRSNHLALLQDYPNAFVIMEESSDNAVLYLPMDGTLPDGAAESLTRLLDYGLYDEEHYSELEQQLLTEWWDTNGIGDFMWDLERALTGDRCGHMADFKVTGEWVKEYVWAEFRAADCPIEVEDAYTVQFSDQFYQQALEAVEDQIIWDWDAKVTWLTDRQEGLF
jgi:hypothetical protein